MLNLGDFTTSETIYPPLTTYDSNGASVTLTGLAVTDIEIYKDGSVTQRASDNGYALLDTDGIDFDGITGLHGFSVDLSDNSDAGFYANGSQYWLVVNAVTIDGQTVVICYYFSIGRHLKPTTAGRTLDVAATGEAGVDLGNVTGVLGNANVSFADGSDRVDVGSWLGTGCATPTVAGVPETDQTHIGGQAISGYNATLKLKQLDIQNSAGSALVAKSTGSNGHGLEVAGNGTGEGLKATGGATGSGIDATGGATSGHGLYAHAAASGDGLRATGVNNGDGLRLAGAGTGDGMHAAGGVTGKGIDAIGGGTSGAGILASAQANNEAGMELVKHGTGKDLDADDLAEITAARLAELDAGNLPTDVANLQSDTDDIQTRLPAALIGGRMDSDAEAINNNTAAAIRLALSAGQIIPFTVDTVTNGHTPTTTEFQADDITEATADHFNGRIVIWTSGVLLGQATDITDYVAVGGIGQFTVTAMTEAPANNDTGVIV